MKRIGNLYEKVCSIENLQLADEKARKGKLRTYGVIEHDKKREVNLLKLRETLLKRYFPYIEVRRIHYLRTQRTGNIPLALLSRPYFAPRYNERLRAYLGFDLHGGHL